MLSEIPVSHVPGVGRVKQSQLAELGIVNISDLLHYFPVRYEDRSIKPFEAFADGEKVTARAIVQGEATVRWFQRKAMVTVRLQVDGIHNVLGVWFNQPYLKNRLHDGQSVLVYGKYDAGRHRIVVSRTEFGWRQERSATTKWTSIYRAAKGISSQQLQVLILRAIEKYGEQLEERLPHNLTEKYRLITHQAAVSALHFPDSSEALRQAHRRLSFEEFLIFQLQLQWIRRSPESENAGVPREVTESTWDTFRDSLPYPLTKAQVRTCREIQQDLQKSSAMARLVQGDVGSGKTWVGLWAVYATAVSGAQTAFMVPTEILAEQHYREASERLTPLGIRTTLLTGSTKLQERADILESVAAGTTQLLIGTHALLTENVDFADLGLVITDEQHRFGVSQRSVLRGKGQWPDVLFLSATPIPRTLAMAVYGDLDVSVLDELPHGRQPIRTYHVTESKIPRVIRFVRKQLTQGHQVYVVAPLIEESEELPDVASAVRLYDEMKEEFAGFNVALLHGRLAARDKEAVMKSFVQREVQVLVSTTVIEVGIHVPQATVMMIYHAERFGLAQLHQLRGRVGRSSLKSYCFLVSFHPSEIGKKRLETMVESSDGFVIAERDLELRGPGELFGTKQSGLPEFTVGDLSRDLNVMEVAREEARAYVNDPDFWLLPQYQLLRKSMAELSDRMFFKD